METINNIDKEVLLAKVEEMKKQMGIHLSQSMKKQENTAPVDIKSIEDIKALAKKQSPFGTKKAQKNESTAPVDIKSIEDIKARMHKFTSKGNAAEKKETGAPIEAKSIDDIKALMHKRQDSNNNELARVREKIMQSDKYKQMEAKKKLFSGIREYDKSSDVNEFSIGENRLWLDKTTRASLLVRIEAEREAGKESTIFWSNGNEYALPLDEAKSIINSVEVYASECYDNTQRHLKRAKELTTVEEMESYEYKTGYPEKLKF